MKSILNVFLIVFSFIAIATLLSPVVAGMFVKKRNITFNIDVRLFEIYIYFTVIMQFFAVILNYGLSLQNLLIFRIYLPIHTAVFTYFLSKWLLGKNKNVILLVSSSIVISILGDFFMGERNTYPYFMVWFDAILLFILSFLLSFVSDKKKIYLSSENNFIHIGIYLYSIITFIGFFPSQIGYVSYSLFLQSVAIIISNYYFTRSIVCLIHSRG